MIENKKVCSKLIKKRKYNIYTTITGNSKVSTETGKPVEKEDLKIKYNEG